MQLSSSIQFHQPPLTVVVHLEVCTCRMISIGSSGDYPESPIEANISPRDSFPHQRTEKTNAKRKYSETLRTIQ